MKAIGYIMIILIGFTVLVNVLLLMEPKLIKSYFLASDLATGCSLIMILVFTFRNRKKLKKRHANYIHQIFSKN